MMVNTMARRSRFSLSAMRRSVTVLVLLTALGAAHGQGLQIRHGAPVPLEVKSLYESGLEYLVKQQNNDGSWNSSQYGSGPGIDGLCCLVILSSGQDPNFGLYAEPLHKGLRAIIRVQDAETGLLASDRGAHGNMYHQGFGTLALAEAYGAVDETLLWPDGARSRDRRSLGVALELAVRCIVTSQDQNPYGGWRYTPDAKDADVSVSGANIVALLAARNAGIEVPDENIKKAMDLLKQSTDSSGSVAYQVGSMGFSFGDSIARSSIACLSLAIAKEKESEAFQATLKYLTDRVSQPMSASWPEYSRYYMAQALFQGDFDAWQKWNQVNTEILHEDQRDDNSIGGDPYSTAMNLLSMALNYRFLPIYER